jgi:hypothetical protein
MARKTNGNDTPSRRKKAAASLEPPAGEFVPGVHRSAKTVDLNEEIRRRAYEIYLERHGMAGDEHQDWLSAEREIRARHQQPYST